MPKIVDHDARREEIVDAVWRLISRDGIAAATTRNIAAEAGCSSAVLSHYFDGKGDLLNETLVRIYLRAEQRIRACLTRKSGLAALRETILLALPIDEEARLGNQIELAFWGHAVGNRRLAAKSQKFWGRFREIVRQLLIDARRRREIPADTDIRTATDALVAATDGLGVEACLFPSLFPAARQRAVIDRMLAALGERAHAAGPRAFSAKRRGTSKRSIGRS